MSSSASLGVIRFRESVSTDSRRDRGKKIAVSTVAVRRIEYVDSLFHRYLLQNG